jgi:hypothetical protein
MGVFMKLDIKDGFWCLAVPEQDEFNFYYVLPQLQPDEPVQIVVPSAIQMGCTLSPHYYFSASSETARDVEESLSKQASLPAHPFEDITMSDC